MLKKLDGFKIKVYHYNMRYILLAVLLLGLFEVSAQQSEVEKLLKQGRALHAHELYEDAINKYKQAIVFDKKNVEAHYELAYTYLMINDFDEALYYSRIVLGYEDEYWIDALLIYCSVLDHNGKSKQAIKEYRKAIKQHPDEYLLHYNLAKSYEKVGDVQAAESELVKSLSLNKSHIAGHLMLADIKKQQDQVLKSMLPLYYCILIESDELKKRDLLEDLQVRWHVAMVQRQTQRRPVSKHVEVSGLEVAESKLNAIARETDVNNEEDLPKFVDRTIALLTMLNDVQSGEMDFFDIHYVDFFTRLFRAGHAEAYSYFISSSKYNPEVLLWIGEHQRQFDLFVNWMQLQQ